MITAEIEQSRFQALSKSFLKDTDGSNSYGLPGWQAYSQLVGVSRTSKLLFLSMIQQQPKLCGLIERVANGQTTAMAEMQHLTTTESERLKNNRINRRQPPEIGDIIAILLATSQTEGQAPVEVNEWLTMSAQVIPVSTYIQRRGYGDVIRRLYAAWIPKTHQAMAFSAMDLAMRYELETGAEVARRNIASHLNPGIREVSIQVLARFGNLQDIPSLLEMFSRRDAVSGISQTSSLSDQGFIDL